MKTPFDLLRDEIDAEIPQEHEARIRAGLASLLQTPPPAHTPTQAPPPAHPPAQKVSALAPKHVALLIGTHLATGALAYTLGNARVPTPPTVQVEPPSSALSVPLPALPPSLDTNLASSASTASEALSTAIPSVHPSATSLAAVPSPASAFDREQSLLERARGALVRHDGQAAGVALDEYERLFPRGNNREEADYLRIQWAREQGKGDVVQTRGQAFIKRYPKSLFRQRVQNMLTPE